MAAQAAASSALVQRSGLTVGSRSARRQRCTPCAATSASGQFTPAQKGSGLASRQMAACLAIDLGRRRACGSHAAASRVVAALAADPGAAALEKGKQLYADGERMDALKVFETALKQEATLTLETRMELLYSSACCHAAFGDIDSAWQNLRDSMVCGLDYNAVDQNPSLMRMEASPQLRKQLAKFAAGQIKSSGTIAREKFNENRASAPVSSRVISKNMPVLKDLDLDSSTSDDFGAIARRVLALLALSAVAGVVLFNLGLSTFKGT